MARLIPALSYNFILLIKVKDTQFSKVMKVLDLVPYLGVGFTEFFPLLLIIFCLLNTFNIHAKIMNGIGLGQFTFSEILDIQRLAEGISLIAQARIDKERNAREINNHSARIIGGNRNQIHGEESKNLTRPLRK